MYLKCLELEGFKSFVDSTSLTFNNGFTAIVGPNGCGKSNVSDAIRWVIGEQSSKSLRGTRITDLIFNGSGSRKPVNRAEISLTLANVSAGIRIANVPNISEEVKVTRCFHRSGESEFYINEIPCRLKDITDFLLDCGISPKVLTVIEQNHIQDIITTKPEQRRILIEEAAGILKFKTRRNEALRKLDASQQNLDRITDIVQELHRQVESLKRQAAKAERYKKFQGEIKDLSLKLFSKKINQYESELKTIDSEWSKQTETKVHQTAKIATLENQIEQLKITNDELSQSLNGKIEHSHQLASQIGKDENAVAIKNAQIQQATSDIQSAEEENAKMNAEIQGLIRRSEEQRLELSKISEEINQQEKCLEGLNTTFNSDRESLRQCEATVKTGEAKIFSLYQQIAQKKNDLTALVTRIQFLQNKSETIKSEQAETLVQTSGVKDQVTVFELEQEKKINQLQMLKQEQEHLEQETQACRNNLKIATDEHAELREKYLKQSSLHASLNELRNKFEGFDEGIKSLMAQDENGGRMSGLREVLVDVVKTSEQYEMALEAVLGEKLQSIIVDSYSDTFLAIDYLNNEESGRGSFMPLQARAMTYPQVKLNGTSGVHGQILQFIECRDEYRPIIEKLLGNVILVDDLKIALHLHEDPDFNATTVTKNGETIDPQGMVTGGTKSKNSVGLLARNREIETLADQVKNLKAAMDSSSTAVDQTQSKLNQLELDLKQMALTVHETEIHKNNSQKDLEQLNKEIQRLEQKHNTLEYECSTSAHELKELSEQQETLSVESKQAEEEKAREEELLASFNTNLQKSREDLEEKASEISRVKVLIASLKGKRDNTLTETKRISLAKENLEQRIQKRGADTENNRKHIEETQISISALEKEILQQVRQKDQLQEKIVEQEECLREKEETLENFEKEFRTLSRDTQELTESISKFELKRSEHRIQIAHLEEKAFDDFNVNRDEMMRAYESEIDVAEIDSEVKELKGKIDRMGGVNLAALSDFAEANERYTFLHVQQEDLAESIGLLNDTIEQIDRNTSQRFEETFTQVNKFFKEIFSRLFQGGDANLILTDPANPLESGVDIFANPMGKKMQNLSLMSGGEKSLTAIALMFAVFKVRPSPFCLLDEVDAPLDEANVIRFQEMLKEMAVNTQFILITHNQKTMSFADRLYGITMEELGVSKAVSVSFN
jgi:chromosome segregation protein